MNLLYNFYTRYLERLVETYAGPPLNVVATGGGVSVAQIAQIPGCSKVLRGVYLPYATEETSYFISENWYPGAAQRFSEKAVSKDSAEALLHAIEKRTSLAFNKEGSASRCLAVTAALQTTRYRRGDNHAFISLRQQKNDNSPAVVTTWHLTMDKFPENYHSSRDPRVLNESILRLRNKQDELVAKVALVLATEVSDPDEPHLIQGMMEHGTLTCV